MSDVNDILAELCTEFIDWPKRIKGEDGFFAKLLRRYGCNKIFDASMGDGFDTIQLINAGFDVTSNEIDPAFVKQAVENIHAHSLNPPTIHTYDWRDLPDTLKDSHDAVLCLGNSLTYMMTHDEQLQVVRNFTKTARPEGLVVIDHRNYDHMLEERDHILKDPEKNFKYSKKFYYCSDTVAGFPVKIEDDHIVMRYVHRPSGKKGDLTFYPLRRQEVIEVMEDAGLVVVESYGDFRLDDIGKVDFYQHIGVKR